MSTKPAAEAKEADAVPAGHIRVYDAEGHAHDLPTPVWENLGPRQKEYATQPAKPAEPAK